MNVGAPIVFLHGRGLGPETAKEIAPAFVGAEVFSPTGGVALRRGSTWFENEHIGIARPESVATAETGLLAWCDASPLHGRPAWLCGFSNGGAMAAHLLMRHSERFLGAALLSAPLVLPPWPANVLRGKPVFYAHGDAADTVVDQHFYRKAESYLRRRSGARLTVVRIATGHLVSPEVVDALRNWSEEVSLIACA